MDKAILNSTIEVVSGKEKEKMAHYLKNIHALFDAPNTFLFREFEAFIDSCKEKETNNLLDFFLAVSDLLNDTLFNPCFLSNKDYFGPPKNAVIRSAQNREIQQIDLNEAMNNAKSFEEIDQYLKIAEEQKIPVRDDYKDAVSFIKSVKELERSLGKETPKHFASIVNLLYCFYLFISDRFYIDYKYMQDLPYRKALYKRMKAQIKDRNDKFYSFLPYFDKVKEIVNDRNWGLSPASEKVYNSCKAEEKFQKLFKKHLKIDIKKDDDETQKTAKRRFYFLVRDVNKLKVATTGVGFNGKAPQERAKRSEKSKKKTKEAMKQYHKGKNEKQKKRRQVSFDSSTDDKK